MDDEVGATYSSDDCFEQIEDDDEEGFYKNTDNTKEAIEPP